jgi:hypothetical protein
VISSAFSRSHSSRKLVLRDSILKDTLDWHIGAPPNHHRRRGAPLKIGASRDGFRENGTSDTTKKADESCEMEASQLSYHTEWNP